MNKNFLTGSLWAFFAGSALSYLIFGCAIPSPIPITPEPEPEPKDTETADAGLDAGEPATCEGGQRHLERLGCTDLLTIPGDDGEPGTADDLPWSEWCAWVQASGVDTWDLECLVATTGCDEVDACYGD